MNIAQYINNVINNITSKIKSNTVTPVIIGNALTDLANIVSATTVNATNGLSITGSTVQLGGVILNNTIIESSDEAVNFQLQPTNGYIFLETQKDNSSVSILSENIDTTQLAQIITAAGTGSDNQMQVELNIGNLQSNTTLILKNTGINITDGIANIGLTYNDDYSISGITFDNWIPNWKTVKNYVNNNSGSTQLLNYTVSTLPTPPVIGLICYVTDAASPSWGATVVEGGSTVIPVFYNGTNWITV